MQFKDILREARQAASLTQAQLGEIMGVSQDTISYWELGKSKPDFDSILFLSGFFDIPLDELMCIEEYLKNFKKPKFPSAQINEQSVYYENQQNNKIVNKKSRFSSNG